MNKLKILWRSRRTWSSSFFYWKYFMFPHLQEKMPIYYKIYPEIWDGYCFWQSISNSMSENPVDNILICAKATKLISQEQSIRRTQRE